MLFAKPDDINPFLLRQNPVIILYMKVRWNRAAEFSKIFHKTDTMRPGKQFRIESDSALFADRFAVAKDLFVHAVHLY